MTTLQTVTPDPALDTQAATTRSRECDVAFELSVIVPTFNEAGNVPELLRRIARVVTERGIACEVIVVDDGSPDGTARIAREVDVPVPVRVVERTGDRGLSQSVVDGIRIARGSNVLVIDADLQHPPESIPDLVAQMRSGAGVVIGSRYVEGGQANEFGLYRKLNSKIATWLAAPLVGTKITDPMAGFFCVRRDLIDPDLLSPIGYKIGLEIIAKCRPTTVAEVPIRFGSRHAGDSKMTAAEQFNYLRHLRRLYGWRWPGLTQLALFCAVGTCGMVVDLTLMTLLVLGGVAFPIARVVSIGVAMVSNFFLNRWVTFQGARADRCSSQMARFMVACSVGLGINWSVSNALYVLLPSLRWAYQLFCVAGIVTATASNYLLSKYAVFGHFGGQVPPVNSSREARREPLRSAGEGSSH